MKTMKGISLQLAPDEFDRLVTTLEGAKEELEEIERTIDYFVSKTPNRIVDCLEFIRRNMEAVQYVIEEDAE